MNIFNIAWKLIFTKKKFSYTSISLCISVLVSAISVATAISILGISRNYESSIRSSVSSIEPQITVTHLYNETVSASTIDSLKKILYSNHVGYLTYESIACEYLESYAMLKNKNKSIGVLVYGIPQNCLYSIYDFIKPEYRLLSILNNSLNCPILVNTTFSSNILTLLLYTDVT